MISSFVAIILAGASASEPTFPVFGLANSSCAHWNTEKLNSGSRLGQVAYVSGYLTALNMDNRGNQTGEMNVQSAIAFLDDVCTRAPSIRFAVALNFLTTDIHAKAMKQGRRPMEQGL